ncbi:hypothetical protein KM043_002225 [Ampulex compressa]|nr:hypothetical protein KM043_002225 [Ampulex compressa]
MSLPSYWNSEVSLALRDSTTSNEPRRTYFEFLSVTTSTTAVRHVIRQSRHKLELLLLLRVFVHELPILHPEDRPRRALRALTKASHNRRECGQGFAPACEPPHATATVAPLRLPTRFEAQDPRALPPFAKLFPTRQQPTEPNRAPRFSNLPPFHLSSERPTPSEYTPTVISPITEDTKRSSHEANTSLALQKDFHRGDWEKVAKLGDQNSRRLSRLANLEELLLNVGQRRSRRPEESRGAAETLLRVFFRESTEDSAGTRSALSNSSSTGIPAPWPRTETQPRGKPPSTYQQAGTLSEEFTLSNVIPEDKPGNGTGASKTFEVPSSTDRTYVPPSALCSTAPLGGRAIKNTPTERERSTFRGG